MILSERRTLFLLFFSQGPPRYTTPPHLHSFSHSFTLTDHARRCHPPRKGTRLRNSPLQVHSLSFHTHSQSRSTAPPLLSFRKQQPSKQAGKIRSSRYCTVVTLYNNQPLRRPLSQQTLLAMNNHNAYTYERTPRTTTIKTEREAE